MNDNQQISHKREFSRRDFIKTSAVLSMAAMMPGASKVFAAGSDTVRVGVIGCGGRGTYDATYCVNAASNVEIVAMGDLFKDRLDRSLAQLQEQVGDKVKVTGDTTFIGFDAYAQVLASDVDLVILTTPPHFRPAHLEAAVKAGKHVYMEKPVAVDPVGIRSVIASSEAAEKQNLKIMAGTQMRRIEHIVEAMKRIHNGDMGELVSGQCVRLGSGMLDWGMTRKSGMSDMEWQLRRWLFLDWLSGDFITEMHIHNLDLINWALDAHPVKCMAMGGRQVRTGIEYGNIFDHFAVEYEYPNGVRIAYLGSQMEGTSVRNHQRLVGTRGSAYIDFANAIIEGKKPYKNEGESPHPVLRQFADLIDSIRKDQRLNEGRRVAESSLTSIMGRMSAYTGRELSWDWVMNASQLDMSLEKYEFGDLPMGPVAVPGKTTLT